MRYWLILSLPLVIYAKVSNYKPIFSCLNKNLIAIRSLDYNNKTKYVAVDVNNLKTYLLNAIDYNIIKCPSQISYTKYVKLLNYSLSNKKHPLTNDGITNFSKGLYITTDLCPSHKEGFEKRLYKALIEHFENPAPITIFITKRWIKKHQQELKILKNWQLNGNLDITWGNHTAIHRFYPKLPLKNNFVLSSKENLTKDILDLEIELINNNITPSIFFRFPGLVSNKDTIYKVKSLGLITIGADAWLAKGEKPKEGSIILLHGNKNEPKGVDIFLKMLNMHYINKINDIKNN